MGPGGGPNIRRQRLLGRALDLEEKLVQLSADLVIDGLDGHIRLAHEQVQLVCTRLQGEVR